MVPLVGNICTNLIANGTICKEIGANGRNGNTIGTVPMVQMLPLGEPRRCTSAKVILMYRKDMLYNYS